MDLEFLILFARRQSTQQPSLFHQVHLPNLYCVGFFAVLCVIVQTYFVTTSKQIYRVREVGMRPTESDPVMISENYLITSTSNYFVTKPVCVRKIVYKHS